MFLLYSILLCFYFVLFIINITVYDILVHKFNLIIISANIDTIIIRKIKIK